jgi:hypothetical protein
VRAGYGKWKAKYRVVDQSIAFPFLKPEDLMRFLARCAEIGENAVIRQFIACATGAGERIGERVDAR